jgi:hypothetical protein
MTTVELPEIDAGSEDKPVHTLALQGPVLPVGLFEGGSLRKDFDVRPWRMKEERELGALKDKNKNANQFTYIAMVLATMLSKLGPHDFLAMDFKKKRGIVAQMMMADVYYAYLYLRREAIGSSLSMSFKCPSCGHGFAYAADLDTVEVKAVDNFDATKWTYTLKDPFPFRGGTAKILNIGQLLWGTMEGLSSTAINSQAKSSIIRGSVVSVEGFAAAPLADHEIDEMTKRDIEALANEIGNRFLGPDLALECDCPKCSTTIKAAIDWSYEGFFAISSR